MDFLLITYWIQKRSIVDKDKGRFRKNPNYLE